MCALQGKIHSYLSWERVKIEKLRDIKLFQSLSIILTQNNLHLFSQTNWLGESPAVLDILNDLVVGQTLEWKWAESDDLVEENPVAPDIRGRAEDSVSQTLRRHPSDGQHPPPGEPIVNAAYSSEKL